MFNIKRNKRGEIILDINLNPLGFFYNFFSKLDLIFSSKIFYTIPMGIGLGFGFTVIVFSKPNSIKANNLSNLIIKKELIATEIIIKEKNFSANLKEQSKYTLLPFKWNSDNILFTSFPNQKEQIVIASKNIDLEKLTLGQKITIVSKNNGRYSFSVFEIKQIDNNEISYLIANDETNLILLHPINSLGTKYFAASAK